MYGFVMTTLKDRVMVALSSAKQSGRKVSQTDLAKEAGVSRQAVSQWFSGKTNKIDGDALFGAARYLGVRPEWLAGNGGQMTAEPSATKDVIIDVNVIPADATKQKMVPLISWVEAGNWSNDQFVEGEHELVMSVFNTGVNGYALVVQGESMSPRYLPKDVIYVNPDAEPAVGKRVIAHCRDHGKTFKELAIDENGKWVLKALNESWFPRYIPVNDDCQIIGVVVGSVRPE